ncbi:AsmA-like C-terminal region-containing protein [Chelativorans sp. Marseille-P2723]|uniref:AsmA family protein n=1 Tax=Chelativorans sp. Marseille-P2723 TaxID=2709133 RepID=UPI001FEF08B9|nr:AsmA-like C-terminal region-containing protein [Chelativorans sp. Marseille-P2723]
MAPYFIDWTSYRAAFEREAGRILGREVRVEGSATARLLPFPSVTFTDVIVTGTRGETAMTVDEFSMDAELAPFLSGELLIFDMRLVRPSMKIEIGEDGDIDWAVRPFAPFDPRQVTLEKVTVADGTIAVYQRASGRTVVLSHIDSEISARTLAGPWRVSGSLELDGIPVLLTASSGTAGPDGSMRVRVSALPRDFPFMLETDGQARFEEEAGLYSGTFRLRMTAPAEEGGERRIAEAGNRISGLFALDHERLSIEEFRFETGPADDPYIAEGRAAIELGSEPSFSITADGAQIRLGGAEAEKGMAALSADERFAALTGFLANLPRPSIPGTIAVNLPAIVAGDTTIRDISVRAQPDSGGWRVGSMAATLPGRTRFEGDGLLETGESLAFTGSMTLAIRQPSGFAAWLARDVDEAIRRLPAAGFSAEVSLTSDRQRFDNLELILGDGHFRGAIERLSPGDARPSLMLNLTGDWLDVDGMRALAALFIDGQGSNRLVGHDVDLEMVAGPVAATGLSAERLDMALRLREGRLEIDRLTLAGVAEANISATGYVEGLGARPEGQIDAAIVAVDLSPLITMLSDRFPENLPLSLLDSHASSFAGLLGDAEVEVVASAFNDGDTAGGFSVSARGSAGGTAFSFSGSSERGGTSLAEEDFTANFSAQNEDAAALYALFGLPALPLGIAGPADIEVTAAGNLAEGVETSFRLTGEGLSAGFQGKVEDNGDGLAMSGGIRLESQDLEPWLMVAGVSLPGFGYGLPVAFSADIEHREGLTVVSDLTGQTAGSSVRGDVKVVMRNGLPHLTGAVELGGFDLGLVAEMVAGSEAFQNGDGTWPHTPFRQNGQTPLTADIEMASDTLWLGSEAEMTDARLRLRLEPDGVSVTDLSAQFLGGRAEGLADFNNDAGTGLFSAQLSLSGAPVEKVLPAVGLEGMADISASVTASGKSVSAMVAALSGSGSASVKGLEISGINRNALMPIMEQADRLGVEIDAEKVQDFAPALLRSGRFSGGDVTFAFTIANGVVRTPPLQIEGQAARMSVEATADLNEPTLSAAGSITYDAGSQALAGSEPTVRFSAKGKAGDAEAVFDLDVNPLAQFLTQRALEREQARVEYMQAVLLERQRLRREVRYFEALAASRTQTEAAQRAEEAERIRLEAEKERQRRAEEEARRREEEEVLRRAEEGGRQLSQEEGTGSGAAEKTEPQVESDFDSTIERAPLAPPQGAEGAVRQEGLSGREPDFDIEDLSVDQLLRLLGRPSQ